MASLPIRVSIVIALLSVTALGVRSAAAYNHSQRRHPDWNQVGYQLGTWRGQEQRFDPVYGVDPATTSILRVYTRADQIPVVLYVGFHNDITSILDFHTPAICYPAQGWRVMSERQAVTGTFRDLPINGSEIVVDKDGGRRMVMWWYTAGDKSFQFRMRYVYGMLLTSLVTGRTDGSIVRIETPVLNGDERGALHRILDFSHALLPDLEKAMPR